jgi:hypothetical protein
MALQVFPEPSINASQDGVSYTIPTGATQYRITETFVPGIYQITTSPTTSQAFIEFVIGGTILSTTTISGSISYNLSSSCSETLVSGIDPSATNTIVSFDKIGSSISGAEITGTLDTLTTTGTYNQTGKLYVVAVGGGSGGAGSGGNYGGGGGGSGGVAAKLVYTNTPTSYTIGSAGNGGAFSSGANCDSGAGGTTNFGNLLSANGGGNARSGNTGSGGDGGTPGGGAGGNGSLNGQGNNGFASTKIGQTVKAGTTGGGGGGGQANAITDGGGDGGIGTGGRSGIANQDPNAQPATGYGAGGGGGRGGSANHNGGVGRQGVIYVLRGF